MITNTTEEANRDPGGVLAVAAVLGTDAMITRQERDGQRELCASSLLPAQANFPKNSWEILERWGVQVLGPVDGDPLFRRVLLPQGWKLQETEHSMWSKLLDERGRERAAIFYKAAFYDRKAHLNVKRAVEVSRDWNDGPYSYFVKVAGVEVFRGPEISETGDERRERDRGAQALADAYVTEHYPNHEDFTAYWD